MSELKGFKYVTTLVLVFKKIECEGKTKYNTFYSSSKAELIINESDTDDKPRRITKADKDLAKKHGFKDIKFSVKLETFTKLKKRIPSELVFLAVKIKYVTMYVSKKCCEGKHVDLLLVGEEGNRLCFY